MKKHFLVLSLLAVTALPAAADGFYALGNIGQTKFSGDDNETDTALVVGLGYTLNETFSVELGYHDFGGVKFSDSSYYPNVGTISVVGSVDASAVQLSTVAKFPINESFNVYGRLGYAHITLDGSATASAGSDSYTESSSESDNKVTYGVGAGYKVNDKFGLRAEYTKFGDTDISTFTVGGTYAF